MFDWLFNRKIKIKWQEVIIIGPRVQDIFQNLSETFVLGSVGSLKTHHPEFIDNPNWKVETIYDVPVLRNALYGFQLHSAMFFFEKELGGSEKEKKLHLDLLKSWLMDHAYSILKKDIEENKRYYKKYNKTKNIKDRTNMLLDDVIKIMKLTEFTRVNNPMLKTVNSLHSQVCMELASLFGKTKLADKYMLKAGKGILDD